MLWWSLSDVLVMSRVSVMSWWYVGDALVLCWWCLCSVSVMLWWCLSDVWWCCGDVLVMVLRCFGDEYWWILMNIFRFSVGSEEKEWLFDVSLLLGSYAELIFTWTLWMAVNFWAFWLGRAMRICLTTRWGNRWHEAEQKVQYQRRYATKMRAQPLFISRGVAWVMEQKWRTDAGNVGFNPFARTSKIVVFELCRWMTSWLFARWWVDAGTLLDTLIKQLDQVILLLNADDTVVHDAQPP